jgi:hypothetical protein
MTKTLRALVGALTISMVVSACGGSADDTTTITSPTTTAPGASDVIAEFRTSDGETYRVLLTGDAAAQARAAFAAGENPGIPNGYIERGNAGVNLGHEWHIRDVEFADMTIEVCDGAVSYIDELGYDEFVSQHGDQFCPWSAELVDLVEP